MIIADRYGMRKQYLEARKFGLDSLEALEDWDMVREGNMMYLGSNKKI